MVKKRIVAIFLIYTIVFCSFSITCVAINSTGINNTARESVLPENLKFLVEDKCSQHNVFQQAVACEDGSFAIYTYGVMSEGVLSETNKKFIDIYDSNANFLKEISFETSSDVAIEITESFVNIYLYSEVICYDYKKQETSYFLTEDYEVYNSGFVDSLRKDQFLEGEWEYYCEKSFLGYSKLSRTNGSDTQTLFDATTDNIINGDIFISVVFGIFLFITVLKIRQKNKTKAISRQSGDG